MSYARRELAQQLRLVEDQASAMSVALQEMGTLEDEIHILRQKVMNDGATPCCGDYKNCERMCVPRATYFQDQVKMLRATLYDCLDSLEWCDNMYPQMHGGGVRGPRIKAARKVLKETE